jgi:hypothetical protein
VADITYIRQRTEFVYLAVILDAFSRRAVGRSLGRTLEAELAATALLMAQIEWQPPPGLVHYSGRCCGPQIRLAYLPTVEGSVIPLLRHRSPCAGRGSGYRVNESLPEAIPFNQQVHHVLPDAPLKTPGHFGRETVDLSPCYAGR